MTENNERKERHQIDLGHGHRMSWASWNPDRELNPQWRDTAPIERCVVLIAHGTEGDPCESGIWLDRPGVEEIHEGSVWQVIQEEPLTLSPSLLCKRCGDHGYIENGAWRPV